DLPETGEEHRLPVQDGAAGLVADGNAGRRELRDDVAVEGMPGASARVDQDADCDALLGFADELGGVARVLHEPERDVDPGGLRANPIAKGLGAILESR